MLSLLADVVADPAAVVADAAAVVADGAVVSDPLSSPPQAASTNALDTANANAALPRNFMSSPSRRRSRWRGQRRTR